MTTPEEVSQPAAEEKKLEGLGGWLILVGAGIIISPLRIMVDVFQTYPKMFFDGTWIALTTPGNEAYHPFWSTLLVTEMVINIVMVLAWAYIGFLFFSKKRLFPKFYIGVLVFTVIYIPIDAGAVQSIVPNVSVSEVGDPKEFFRSLVQTLIWVPYMLVSKRVKATFVK